MLMKSSPMLIGKLQTELTFKNGFSLIKLHIMLTHTRCFEHFYECNLQDNVETINQLLICKLEWQVSEKQARLFDHILDKTFTSN